MHYYKRNLGDYAKKAGRLSMLQHGSYTLLIDACYDREQFPTKAEAIDWAWAISDLEIEAVEFVLGKFFTLEDGKYVQERIREELAEYHGKAATNKRIADEREAKRKETVTNREPVVHETLTKRHLTTNHKPITNNQEPETNNQKPETKNHGFIEYKKPNDIDEELWLHFVAHRKKKKAAITEIAMNGILREAGKAGYTLTQALTKIMERNWTGFESEWVLDKPPKKTAVPMSSKDYREGVNEDGSLH